MNRKLFLAAAALGLAATGIEPASAIPDLTKGIAAPTAGANVGAEAITKGTMQYSNSAGASDAFSVGTQTNISANASASSTADYNVKSVADFGMGFQATAGGAVTPTTINQVIGSSGTSQSTITDIQQAASSAAETAASKEVESRTEKTATSGGGYSYRWWNAGSWQSLADETAYNNKRTEIRDSAYTEAYNSAYSSLTQSSALSGTISGSFEKDLSATNPSNNVTVRGIGANNTITAASDAGFSTQIDKNLVVTNQAAIDATPAGTTPPAPIYGSTDSAGTASGSASGNVSTTASANANSTEFVSSFVQAY